MSRKKNTDEAIKMSKLFAKKLKDERLNLGLSQDALSKKTNISIDTIRSLEGGRIVSPSLFVANRLVKGLDGDISIWLRDLEQR